MIVPQTPEEVEKLAQLLEHPQLDFWTDIGLNRAVYIMTTPELENSKFLSNLGSSLVVENVQTLINEEKASKPLRFNEDDTRSMTWDDYYSYDDVRNALHVVA